MFHRLVFDQFLFSSQHIVLAFFPETIYNILVGQPSCLSTILHTLLLLLPTEKIILSTLLTEKFPQTEEYEVNLRRARFERCYKQGKQGSASKGGKPVLEGYQNHCGETLTLTQPIPSFSVERKINAEIIEEGEILVPGRIFSIISKSDGRTDRAFRNGEKQTQNQI